ncbi:MAG TPA: ChaB family protein [Anaerolineae bacterium]|nr:ChaB family protein [Anaerolineae bacterium]
MDLVQLPVGTDKRGLNLAAPHGYLIWSGRKTSIAKAKPFDLSGPWILVSGGKAYGTMEVSLPEPVSVEEFDTLFDEHRVTTDERATWWADKETLYLSDIVEFNAFPKPMQIHVFPGMQTVVEEVEFSADEPDLEEHCDSVRFVIEAKQENDLLEELAPIEESKEEEVMPYDKPPERIAKLPEAAQHIWVSAFNSAHEKYPDDEERCNKIAWGAVKDSYEQDADGNWSEKALGGGQGVGGPRQGVGGASTCVCPKCGTEKEHDRGTPCAQIKCPKCGAMMAGKKSDTEAPKGVLSWLRQRFDGLLGDLKGVVEEKPAVRFKTFVSNEGHPWLLTWTTNAFRDREREIFETKAIEDFVERHKDDEVKGHFWFWHLPGAKFGDIKWQAMSGRFLVEGGPFDDTPIGRKFAEFFSEYPQEHPELAPEGWGTSHGYYYTPQNLRDGVYDWFEKFETTVLPRSKASNQHSPKMEVLPMNAEQRKALELVGGPELVKQVEQIGDEHTKELEEQGVAFKAAEEVAEVDIKEVVDSEDEIVVEAEGNAEAVKAEAKEGAEDTLVEAKEAQAAEIAEPSVDSTAELAQQIVAGLNLGGLAQAIKSLQESVNTIAEKQDAQDGRLKSLEDVGVEDGLSPLIPMPHAALWRASRMAQTETDEVVAEKSKPELPDVIAEFSRLVPIA